MRKRTWIKWILRIALLALVLFGWWFSKLIWFKPMNIDHFYERVFIRFMLRNPELLTRMRILEPLGLDFHNDDLTDASPDFDRDMLQYTKDQLAILRSYDLEQQDESQQLSTRILDYFLADQARTEPFLFHNYPVNQMSGIQSDLPSFMTDAHQIHSRNDADNYIRDSSQ